MQVRLAAAVASTLNDVEHAGAYISSVVRNSPMPLADTAATVKRGVRRLRAKANTALQLGGFTYWLLGLKGSFVLQGPVGGAEGGEDDGEEGGARLDGDHDESPPAGRAGGARARGGSRKGSVGGGRKGRGAKAVVAKPRARRAPLSESTSEAESFGEQASEGSDGDADGGNAKRGGNMRCLRPRTGTLAATTRHAKEIAQSDEIRSRATGGYMAPDAEYQPSTSWGS